MTLNPAHYKPRTVQELIGPARAVGAVLEKRAAAALTGNLPVKLLIYGAPGLGKTELANLIGQKLATTEFNIERYNGKQIDVERVRGWMDRLHCRSMFDGHQVWLVDEADTMSKDAQNLMLTFLDRLEGRRAFIATSNLHLELLQERFQSRFQKFKVAQPRTEELVQWLVDRWQAPMDRAVEITVGSGLNVRCALLDLQTKLDEEMSES